MKKLFTICLFVLCTTVFSQTNSYWETINFPDSLNPITINAQREGILFVSGDGNPYGGLFRSFDEGQSWEQIEYDSLWSDSPAYNILYSLDNILFIGTSFGIYRSQDDGDTFEKVHSEDYGAMKFRFSPENHLYTVGWGIILRTKDLGYSWDTVSYHGWTKFYSDIAFGINGELYAVGGGYHPFEGGFYRSLDDGESWQNIGITNIFLRSVAVNSNGTILAGGHDADNVYKSYDNGETWINTGSILVDEVETYGNDLLIVGENTETNRGCWFSEDWGESWVNMEDDILNSKITTISISPSYTIYIRSHWLPSNPNQLFRSVNPILKSDADKREATTNIYPNPASSLITLSNPRASLQLHTLHGQTVFTSSPGEERISIEGLAPGLYVATIRKGHNLVAREKLVVK